MLHRLVLDDMGCREVPIYAPNQDDGLYHDLGVVGGSFVRTVWEGVVAVDLLTKCLHETRPYEKDGGTADAAYGKMLAEVVRAVESGGLMKPVLQGMREEFAAIARTDGQKPLIGVVGEIYVRGNQFSNENAIRKVEALGGVVWLAPFGEWIFYQNYTNLDNARQKGRLGEYFNCLTASFVQKRIDHAYASVFEGFLKTLHEPEIKHTLKLARPYLRDTFQGEAILSIGKSVDLAHRGVCGVLNLMPFNCMPGTIVTALLKKFSDDLGGFPYLSMQYDGNEQANAATRMEAFIHQAKQRLEEGNSAARKAA
jgi:predicted nucleotide-binding protein (sugar kinase/HSP70/actin superfamily)